MKERVNAVTAIRLDGAATLRFCVFLDHVARFTEEHARFDDLDGFVEAFAGCLDDSDGVGIREGFVADVVCFV